MNSANINEQEVVDYECNLCNQLNARELAKHHQLEQDWELGPSACNCLNELRNATNDNDTATAETDFPESLESRSRFSSNVSTAHTIFHWELLEQEQQAAINGTWRIVLVALSLFVDGNYD